MIKYNGFWKYGFFERKKAVTELMETLLRRRSIRRYTGEAIPDELIRQVVAAGLASETSKNTRGWELIVVRDKKTLAKMAHFRLNSARMLEGADTAIVTLVDEEKTDVWTEDGSVAMAHMHLMADSLGLGSCWIQGRLRRCEDGTKTSEEYLRELLGFPANMRLLAVLSLGMPADRPHAHTEEHLRWDKVHREKWTDIFRA